MTHGVGAVRILRVERSQQGRKRMGKHKRDDRGFTLIEIMIVIVILSILVWQLAPRIMGKPEEARRLKARMDISTLETALKFKPLFHVPSAYKPITMESYKFL